MSFVAAIDAGGTQTRCVVASGDVVYEPYLKSTAKPSIVGYDGAGMVLFESVLCACAAADVPFNLLKGISIGIAGVWTDEERSRLGDALYAAAHTAMYALPRICIVSDLENAALGALPGQTGIVGISGTGSVVVAKDDEGILVRIGGYGPFLGDEGSGAWIGQRAFMLSAKALDGRHAMTSLRGAVADMLDLRTVNDLRSFSTTQTSNISALASLFPLVAEHAGHGDEEALTIINDAVDELCAMVRAARRSLHVDVPVCWSGGVAEHPLVNGRLREATEHIEGVWWSDAHGSGLDGAILRGRSLWL